jgi:SAM-dependent MidA family methyltransferase
VCTDRLQWVLVERTAAQRARHVERLGASSDPDSHRPISGVHLVSVASLPDSFPADVVLANELLDNLPVRVAQRTTTGWSEVWVGVEGSGLVEELQPLPTDDPDSLMLDRLVPDASPGQRVPLQHEARSWLRWALGAVGTRGRVVVLDYAGTTASMARRGPEAWMRTYASHGRGAGPLEACGTQDLTCDVAIDQLAEVRPPDAEVTQAEFLGSHGIDELVEQGRQMWVERAHIGDLAAVRARSRVREAEALVDLDGLGAHRVLEWWPTDTADPGSG